jgi:hypothetical protein
MSDMQEGSGSGSQQAPSKHRVYLPLVLKVR